MNLFLSLIPFGLSSTYPSLPDGDSFLEKIVPNIWAFLVQFLALIVLIIIFFVVAYKPVRNIIKKRQDHIEGQINEATRVNTESKEKLIEATVTLKESKKEAIKIIDDAKEDANKQREVILKNTNEEITNLKIKAQQDIEREKERAKDEIKRTIIDTALLTSKEILKREVNENDNEKIIDDYIDNLTKDN